MGAGQREGTLVKLRHFTNCMVADYFDLPLAAGVPATAESESEILW
jgi:hypothetical protein